MAKKTVKPKETHDLRTSAQKRDDKIYSIVDNLNKVSDANLDKLNNYLKKPNKFNQIVYTDIDMSPHTFKKHGVDADGNPTYKCIVCGEIGHTVNTDGNGIMDIKIATDLIKSSATCEKADVFGRLAQPKGQVFMLRDIIEFGLKRFEKYDIVPCPANENPKFYASVWVFSTLRKEPVRLLNGEYSLLKD